MSDGGVIIGSIVAGVCSITLFLVKKITECICSKKLDLSGDVINRLDTIPTSTLPLAWHHNKDWGYENPDNTSTTCMRNDNDTISINITDTNESVYAFKYISNSSKPESGHHYFYINLEKISDNAKVYICIKRFDKAWNQVGTNKKKYVGSGSYDIFEQSMIGIGNIHREQIGVMVESKNKTYPVTCVIQKAYYSDVKNKQYIHMVGKISPCCIKKYMCLCSCKTIDSVSTSTSDNTDE